MNEAEHLQKLIDGYLNGSLSDIDGATLNRMLDDSRAARDEFRNRIAFHDSLYEHFSDAEDVLGFEVPSNVNVEKAGYPLAWVPAAAVAILLFVTFWRTGRNEPIATLVHATAPNWVMKSAQDFHAGWHELKSGLVVLQIGEGVRLAVEGPTLFQLHDAMRMTIERGRISALVEESGHGFTIETPEGRIVDFGTRFGVHVRETGETEAHVFEGAIDVENTGEMRRLTTAQAVQMKGLAEIGSDPLSFPMPGRDAIAIPLAGDFDAETQLGTGMPKSPGVWGGDHCEIVSQPKNRTALEFIAPHARGEVSQGQMASEMWQLLDLSEIADEVHQGAITANFSASFNKSASVDSVHFQIQLVAFSGQLSQAEEYWDRKNEPTSKYLTQMSASLVADDDPISWEPLEVSFHVPRGTDFLLVSLLARDTGQNTFSGCFADDAFISLASEPRASVNEATWKGGAGNWNRAENWQNGKPDTARDRIVIIGGGETVISQSIQLKQDAIIALHRESCGRLRIAPGGRFAKSGHGSLYIGFNPGAEAELIIEGSLETRGRAYIGRHNAKSLVDLAGGTWNAGDGLIRMAQYGNWGPDTESKLWVRQGGTLRAATLEMVHDLAELHVEDGTVELENLRIGGNDGQALVRLSGGELNVDNLVFGPGNGALRFDSQEAKLLLRGSWTARQLLAIPRANWQLGDNAVNAQDFILTPHGDFTQIQATKATLPLN